MDPKISRKNMQLHMSCKNNKNNKISLWNQSLQHHHMLESLQIYQDLDTKNERERNMEKHLYHNGKFSSQNEK